MTARTAHIIIGFCFALVVAFIFAVVASIGNGSSANADSGQTSNVSAPKEATNVETIQVPGKNGFNEVIVFDIERDGQILTCTTKSGFNSGVGCVVKK